MGTTSDHKRFDKTTTSPNLWESPAPGVMASFPSCQVFSQVIEGEWTSVKYIDVLGVKIPAFYTTNPQLLRDFIANFETRPDDVFVVGFPKSGAYVR